MIFKISAVDGTLLWNSIIGTNSLGVAHWAKAKALTFDIWGNILAGFKFGPNGGDDLSILRCDDPMGVKPRTAVYYDVNQYVTYPSTITYISALDYIIVGAHLNCQFGACVALSSPLTVGFVVFNAQTLSVIKFFGYVYFSAGINNDALYNFDINQVY